MIPNANTWQSVSANSLGDSDYGLRIDSNRPTHVSVIILQIIGL